MTESRVAGPSTDDTTEALAVLRTLRERGVSLWVEDGKLRYRSPKATLESADLLKLRRLKEEIILLMGGDVLDAAPLLLHDHVETAAPLTPLQCLIWANESQLATWSRSHAFVTRIHGSLQTDVLSNVLHRVVTRHRVLRTTVSIVNGEPIHGRESRADGYPEIVESKGSGFDVEASLREFLDVRIDIGGPFFDSRLFRLADQDHVLAVSLDELVTDCRSDDLLSREIWAEYESSAIGETLDAREQQPQFADYALWLWNQFPSWRARHAPYWCSRFSDRDPSRMKQSDTERNRGPVWSHSVVNLDENATEQLGGLAREADVYLAVAMLAAFLVAAFGSLHRSDVTVIVIDSGRDRPELKNMIGPLVNRLHLRLRLDGKITFAQLMQNVAAELRGAYEHRDFNWLPSLVPDLRADLYFNWITESANDTPSEQTAASRANLDLRRFAPPRLGLPPAPLGMVLRHLAQIRGELICETGLLGSDGEVHLLEAVYSALQGLRDPGMQVQQLLATRRGGHEYPTGLV